MGPLKNEIVMQNPLEKMKSLAHQIHGLNIEIDVQWRIADDSRSESVCEKAKEKAHELLAELQCVADDLANLALGLA